MAAAVQQLYIRELPTHLRARFMFNTCPFVGVINVAQRDTCRICSRWGFYVLLERGLLYNASPAYMTLPLISPASLTGC